MPAAMGDQLAVIILGDRTQRQPAALLVQALAVGQARVVEHDGDDALAFDRGDLRYDAVIQQQQHVAGHHVAGQFQGNSRPPGTASPGGVGQTVRIETLAGLELHLAFGKGFPRGSSAPAGRRMPTSTDLAAIPPLPPRRAQFVPTDRRAKFTTSTPARRIASSTSGGSVAGTRGGDDAGMATLFGGRQS